MLLISTDFCCYRRDCHHFPLYWGNLAAFSLANWTPQLDWNTLFTGLLMVTDGLTGGVLKVHEDSVCQMRRVFPKLTRSNFGLKKANHPIEVMAALNINT